MPSLRRKSSRPDRTWTDRQLVDACLAGASDGWEALLAKYKNLIYSVPIRHGMAPDDANDIFQAVCVELFNGLPDLRQVESLPGWLTTVAKHRVFHWKKTTTKRLIREGTDLEVASPDVLAVEGVDLLALAQHEQGIREAVDRLPERCQQLVRMLFFEPEPRPYAAIASELGLAQGSIGFIRGRCLKRLRKELEKAGYS